MTPEEIFECIKLLEREKDCLWNYYNDSMILINDKLTLYRKTLLKSSKEI